MTRHANFKDFPSALLVLFRMSTGESWNGIMHDCMNMADCLYVQRQDSEHFGEYFSANSLPSEVRLVPCESSSSSPPQSRWSSQSRAGPSSCIRKKPSSGPTSSFTALNPDLLLYTSGHP